MIELNKKPVFYPKGDNILDKEWDILIILDACRWDAFDKVINGMGKIIDSGAFFERREYNKTSYIISVASTTGEFIQNTFKGRDCKDIIYISSTPWISDYALTQLPGMQNIGYNPFYKIVPTYNTDPTKYKSMSERPWDPVINPKDVTKIAMEMHKDFPSKRLIIHYMQPHVPFIGKTKISQELWEPMRKEMFRIDKMIHGCDSPRKGEYKPQASIWEVMKEGILTREFMWKAYIDNLKFVLEELKEWKKFKGKIIITADHGMCFLDWGLDGYPSGLRIEELVKVPWYCVKEREEIKKAMSILIEGVEEE
jgi:hypothetical protein